MFEAVMIQDDRTVTDEVAARAAASHGFTSAATIRPLRTSQNVTYLVSQPASRGERSALIRVHGAADHDARAIESELDWLEVLARRGGVGAARPLTTAWGARLLAFPVAGRVRHAVAFEPPTGSTPDHGADPTVEDLRRLGTAAAMLHESARHVGRPVSRPRWDWEHTLGASCRSSWQEAPGVSPELAAQIAPAVDLLRNRLAVYGRHPDRFGLIHADLRPANLVQDGADSTVIGFDACGFGWFMYDFAAAVSSAETDPRLPAWQAAWVDGYRSVRPLARPDERMLPSFVLLRRLLALAHTGNGSSRGAYEPAEPYDPQPYDPRAYAEDTAALARAYLANAGQLTAAA